MLSQASSSSSPSSNPSTLMPNLSFLWHNTVYPCLLPTLVTYTHYIAALTNAPTLYEIEKLPLKVMLSLRDLFVSFLTLFVSVLINLDCHCPLSSPLTPQWRPLSTNSHYSPSLWVPHIPWTSSTRNSPSCIPPNLPVHVSHRPGKILETGHFGIQLSSNRDHSHFNPHATPTGPSFMSLASQISSRPASPTKTLIPESGFSQENALLIQLYGEWTPGSHHVMASPTHVLPSTYLKPLATPATQCFLWHNYGYYSENCSSHAINALLDFHRQLSLL